MKPHQSISRFTSEVPVAQDRFRTRQWVAVLGASVLLLAACASSEGIRSEATVLKPEALGLAAATPTAVADTVAPLQAEWWLDWRDPVLTELITQALKAQPSLKVAQARLSRAQAGVAGERASEGPKVNGAADVTRQRFSATSIYPAPLGGSIRTLASAQLSGSWEFDFFGRHHAAMEAALGTERAAAADVQAARTVLANQVAQTYVQLGRLVAQREVAQRSLAQRNEMLGLVRQRVDAGLDSQIELRQGEGALPEARQQLEQIDEQMVLTRHALAALSAQAPNSLDVLSPQLADLHAVSLPERLPADLLGRRADITAARWRMEAATQGVRVAKTQFYPNINLTAFVGLSSIGLDRLTESGSQQYGVGPAIRLPIFDAGNLRANLRGKAADLDAAVESYNGAVLEAVREVADQLGSQRSIERQQVQQVQAQAAAESAYAYATERYRAGLSTHLTVLNAESAMLNQRRQAVDLQARALAVRFALIRALGGGYGGDAAAPQAQGATDAPLPRS